MPKRSRNPRNLSRLAANMVDEATSELPPADADDGKDPHAVALGRRGGLKGGKARAAKLTAEERRESARRAAAARWTKHKPTDGG